MFDSLLQNRHDCEVVNKKLCVVSGSKLSRYGYSSNSSFIEIFTDSQLAGQHGWNHPCNGQKAPQSKLADASEKIETEGFGDRAAIPR